MQCNSKLYWLLGWSQHVAKIIVRDEVYISYTTRELTPTLLLTEKVAFLGLPDPKPDEFKRCLKIPDEKIIEHLGRYIRIWYAKSERLSSKEDLEKLKRLIENGYEWNYSPSVQDSSQSEGFFGALALT